MNRKALIKAEILRNREIAPEVFLLSMRVPESFSGAPGQFVMVRFEGLDFPLLGRPISIHSLYRDRKGAICDLLYRVVGIGSAVLSRMKKGGRLLILGPLGRGFTVRAEIERVFLVAGGMGVAPLFYLAEYYRKCTGGRKREIICFLGARNADTLLDLERLRKTCSEVLICTDDGSRGFHGQVTQLLAAEMGKYTGEKTAVFACGPRAMLAALSRQIAGESFPCEVSVEEKMACGIGACLSCAVSLRGGAYARVCKEGPVFDIRELDWDHGSTE
ncbi:MAG: dihydroorotate dehydrogenase electron transfer subunit [Syntrophales bacterium]|nr:dihydroorotate dehydrogenase electron transfer subunit [Syntrophales bacterium]